jgi:Rhs element Vgr protein
MPVANATVLSGTGKPMDTSYRLLSIDVRTEVNRIPTAEIRFLDGSVLNEYAVSDGAFFEPGKEIEIRLRQGHEADASIFKGIVVRQTLEWTARGSVLVVRLKDAAVKLTGKRQSAVYSLKADDAIIKEMLGAAGVGVGSIKGGSPTHPAMVQYDSTPWDFICLRAEALGMVVTVEAGALSLQPMDGSGSSVKHSFTWGTNMYEFEVEAAAEHPYAAVESVAWDPSQNALTNPAITASTSAKPPGDLDPGKLAKAVGRDEYLMKHPVPAVEGELKAWANGRLARSVLSMLRGRISIPGNAKPKLLDTLEIKGVGKRFSGTALITAIQHKYDTSGWRTEVQFGLSPERHCQREDIADVPAAGLLPPVRGLQIGVVAAFESDPDGELRVKVILPGVDEKSSGAMWARLCAMDAGANHGFFFRPDEGDEVVVGFLFDDPRHPVILGSMYGSKNAAPSGFAAPEASNKEKGLITKKGTTLKFLDGEKPALHIMTAGGNSIVIDDEAQGITVKDQHGHSIVMNSQGITIDAGNGNVTIKGSKVDVQ